MIYRDSLGKMIGKLDGSIFKKSVQKSKHLFRASNSWAIQERVLNDLLDDTRIEIFDKEDKILYVTTAGEFKKHCTFLEFGDSARRGSSLAPPAIIIPAAKRSGRAGVRRTPLGPDLRHFVLPSQSDWRHKIKNLPGRQILSTMYSILTLYKI